ncbi:MAG: deoxyribose-phosphate aldolase [Aquificaceae bacterium]
MDIAKLIDHSILRPYHTLRDLEEQVSKCIGFGVYGVCVYPFWIRRAVELAGKELVVCSVISFPFGLDTKEEKLFQSVKALEEGAKELDIVINISAFKSGLYKYVEEELKAIVRNTEGSVRKVIIETAYLTEKEKALAVEILLDSGVEFVKTSTGYAPTGATEEDVSFLLKASREKLKVKASGGIRKKEQAIKFIELGAHRLGTSSTFEILGG